MAARTITFDAGEFIYVDSEGIRHTVTTSQTLDFNIVDTRETDVKYHLTAGQSVTTTDGYRLHVHPGVRDTYLGTLTDAGQGAAKRSMGDWVIRDPKTHKPTRWKCTSMNENDADAPTEITATFENIENTAQTFTWTAVTAAA